MKIETIPDPVPRAREVVVSVRRCGICASDLRITEPHNDSSLPPLIKSGTVIGHEYAGEVVALGDAVENLKIGDRVAPMAIAGCGRCVHCLAGEPMWCERKRLPAGGYAELAAAREDICVKLPSTVTMEDGALIEPIACGLHAAALAAISPGARILVIGAGPIALGAMFWARRLGAGRMAATATSDWRAGLARAVGATGFVVSGPGLAASVGDILKGPPDIVFECVGKPGLVDQAIQCVRPGGTVVVASFCTHTDTVAHSVALLKQIRLQYSLAYSLREFELTADMFDEGHPELTSMVTDRVSFDEFPAAFEALRNRTAQCKVMLDTGI